MRQKSERHQGGAERTIKDIRRRSRLATSKRRPGAAWQQSLQPCVSSLAFQSSSGKKPYFESDHFSGGGSVGLYFIRLTNIRITYPFRESGLIYIGMSESRHNSIGRRLRAHLTGQSGNHAIRNYAEHYSARFAYHPFELLQNLGATSLYEIESFFLGDFLRHCQSK